MCQNTNTPGIIHVLMVDSEHKLLMVTKKYFSCKNIHILTATTLKQAWSTLHTDCPDLLILDIAICNSTENEFMQHLLNDRTLKHIPVIFLTAKGLTEDRIKGYNLGCNLYLSKPFDPEELKSIIINLWKKNALSISWMLQTQIILKNIKTQLQLKTFPKIHSKLNLTNTEKLIFTDILHGKQNHNIARIRNTSTRHVENYVTRILDKTSTTRREELQNLPWCIKNYGE